jgi:hypothetical protein
VVPARRDLLFSHRPYQFLQCVFSPPFSPFNPSDCCLPCAVEECRAEAVALYLASNKDIAAIFGFSGKDAEDLVVYTFLGSFSLLSPSFSCES